MVSPAKESVLDRLGSCLQTIKRSIPTNQEHSMEICFSDFNSLMLTLRGHFFEIINLMATFLDEFLFCDLQKSKVFLKPSTKSFVFEQILHSLTLLNKQNSEIDEEGLNLQLLLILTKIEVSSMKTLEKFLDSLYMCSCLSSFLKVTLHLYKSCECIHQPTRQFYTSWICKKIELSESTLMDYDEFQSVEPIIHRCLLRKIRGGNSSVESERVSFMTP